MDARKIYWYEITANGAKGACRESGEFFKARTIVVSKDADYEVYEMRARLGKSAPNPEKGYSLDASTIEKVDAPMNPFKRGRLTVEDVLDSRYTRPMQTTWVDDNCRPCQAPTEAPAPTTVAPAEKLAAGEYIVDGHKLTVAEDGHPRFFMAGVYDEYGNFLFPVPASEEELAANYREYLEEGE